LAGASGSPTLPANWQNSKAWLSAFNDATGGQMSVSGFCAILFEHPGFRANDDAHIFEIHAKLTKSGFCLAIE
jgi:hypothetical protein